MTNVGIFMDNPGWSEAIDYAISASMEPRLNIHRGWDLKSDGLLISDRIFQLTNYRNLLISKQQKCVHLPQLGYLRASFLDDNLNVTQEDGIWVVKVKMVDAVTEQAEVLIERIMCLVEKINERSE